MAHDLNMAPAIPSKNPYRKAGTPLLDTPIPQTETPLPPSSSKYNDYYNDCLSSSEGASPSSSTDSAVQQGPEGNSDMAGVGNMSGVRTRSIPYEATAIDDDVIMVTVRLSNHFRKHSVTGAEDLPSRPQRRSFFRRLSTRVSTSWDHAAEQEERYKAVKMPRSQYHRHFRRDKDGNFAGTAEEKVYYEAEELMSEFADYQAIPLHTTCFEGRHGWGAT